MLLFYYQLNFFIIKVLIIAQQINIYIYIYKQRGASAVFACKIKS